MNRIKRLLETTGLNIGGATYDSAYFYLTINGTKYTYSPNNTSPKQLYSQWDTMRKYSEGKALAYIKNNSEVVNKEG